MPVRTNYRFKKCVQAIKKIAKAKGFVLEVTNKRGSVRHFELFEKENMETPKDVWVFHESDYIYTRDLKKIYEPLGITEKEFKEFI